METAQKNLGDLLNGSTPDESDRLLGCTPNQGDAAENLQAKSAGRDEEFNTAISQFQAELSDWNLDNLSLSDLARHLQDWGDDLWLEFLPKEWKGVPIAKPVLLFLFERESRRILGHYHPGRNGAGLRWEISVNPANLHRLSQIEIAGIVLHEELHAFEDLVGSAPQSSNGYHSSWLRNTAEQLGIPCTRFGCTCGIRPGSPFADWAARHGLTGRPVLAMLSESEARPEPKQKRRSWVCNCPAEKVVRVYVASGSTLRARCELCGALFRPQERIFGTQTL